MALNFNMQDAMAKVAKEKTKVSFTMTGIPKVFVWRIVKIKVIVPLGCSTDLRYLIHKGALSTLSRRGDHNKQSFHQSTLAS
ncbi:hypothetical protein BL1202_02130 [Bacillus licheniformis]|nr:hypothetical protein BL1202_02130 [Bacillus licheniformis]